MSESEFVSVALRRIVGVLPYGGVGFADDFALGVVIGEAEVEGGT